MVVLEPLDGGLDLARHAGQRVRRAALLVGHGIDRVAISWSKQGGLREEIGGTICFMASVSK